ncbi:SRPBCC domain-containing protein [Pseudophaeobacter sp.]|uniref:SRPBCC family protein n=1 Tax=Pseudophaeobacter sp. TaxID=1971739 RepID=UPI00329A2C56
MTKSVLRKTIYLQASPEKVWEFLTDPERLTSWFHRPTNRLTPGAALEMHGADSGDLIIWGEVLQARAPEYLEYSFCIKPMGGAVSTVKWTLTPVPGGTQLSLEHEGLPQQAEAFGMILSLDKGWDKHFASLRTALHATVAA